MTTWDQVQVAAAAIRAAIAPRKPCLGLVLGSGLGDFAERLQGAVAVPYAALPGFVPSTVAGHAGRLIAGNCAGVPLLVLQGRVHRYEGHSLAQVVLPVRALVAAGCTTLVLTNAAGGIRADLGPGSLVLISDHLNLLGDNPLCGANDERLGPRFPDLSEVPGLGSPVADLRRAREAGVPVGDPNLTAFALWGVVPGFASLAVTQPDIPHDWLVLGLHRAYAGLLHGED